MSGESVGPRCPRLLHTVELAAPFVPELTSLPLTAPARLSLAFAHVKAGCLQRKLATVEGSEDLLGQFVQFRVGHLTTRAESSAPATS